MLSPRPCNMIISLLESFFSAGISSQSSFFIVNNGCHRGHARRRVIYAGRKCNRPWSKATPSAAGSFNSGGIQLRFFAFTTCFDGSLTQPRPGWGCVLVLLFPADVL